MSDRPGPFRHDSKAMLTARSLTVRVGGAALVRELDLVLGPGLALALVGPSGSGKSTLARALVGLEGDLTGSLSFDGRELVGAPRPRWTELRSQAHLIWQDPATALDPHLTIFRAIDEARVLAGKTRLRRHDAHLLALLQRVALDPAILDRRPAALSGGQRQRAALARALACEPSMLIADEITSALDPPLVWTIVELLRSLRTAGIGLLMISHDMSLLPGTVDELLVLDEGRVVERGQVSEVLRAPQHATTRALIAAAPRLHLPLTS